MKSFSNLEKEIYSSEELLQSREKKGVHEKLKRLESLANIGLQSEILVHDINNLLQCINGAKQLLELTELDEKQAQYMKMIDKGINKIIKLSENLSGLTKNNFCNENSIFDMHDSINNAVYFLESSSKKIDYRIGFNPKEFFLKGNQIELTNSLFNLGKNATQAIEYSGKGDRISFDCKTMSKEEPLPPELNFDLPYHLLSINDNGPGIPLEYQNKIFEPFFTTKKCGTGLGLLSVKESVEAYNGAIDFHTSPEGTTFNLYLPSYELKL